ncbi:MAG: hypoxanthine phosphoribosyltransferase [Bulleidia sp.]
MWEEKDIDHIIASADDITKRAKQIGAQITEEYRDHPPVLVALLRGSVPFLAELIRYIDLDIQYDFMDVSSYVGTQSSGDIRILKDLETSVVGKDVLIVEDIVETGRTLATVKKTMMHKGASSVKIVSLLDKPCGRTTDIDVDYVGFTVGPEFVIGFGMDFNQKYRCLPYIGVLKKECYTK